MARRDSSTRDKLRLNSLLLRTYLYEFLEQVSLGAPNKIMTQYIRPVRQLFHYDLYNSWNDYDARFDQVTACPNRFTSLQHLTQSKSFYR